MAEAAEPAPRPDEAVVAVEAFSPNRGELYLLERPRPGWRPGKDIAGRVLRVGADGTGPAAGERVVGHPPASGWSERIAVPTRALAQLPDGVEMAEAAALPLAGLTALRLLRAAGPIAGAQVLVTGASGGVGHYVTELAAAVGRTSPRSAAARSACSLSAPRRPCPRSTGRASRSTSCSNRSAARRSRTR